ncbi:hypothetical protein NDU88_003652 [Pleurodeles waltl]|uniref:Uncharacterized protein n=1 Tax=Pleurodeles waltl TaxID=8319 RepID=A0AAV7W5N9_PLEWA|nr:hypothetical protein NDU88_003652 [Pleurodeles waltl]
MESSRSCEVVRRTPGPAGSCMGCCAPAGCQGGAVRRRTGRRGSFFALSANVVAQLQAMRYPQTQHQPMKLGHDTGSMVCHTQKTSRAVSSNILRPKPSLSTERQQSIGEPG